MGVDDSTRVVADDDESGACVKVSRFVDTAVHFQERNELERGDTVDRYVVVSSIGAGGMGHVYAAYDPELDRKVAIKTLRRRDLKPYDGEALLLHEAKTLAKLSHPNVVNIYDAGTQDDQLFIAMEYVEGVTLREWLHERPRTWVEILDVFLAAGRGLAAAHAAGIIHRDFKPANVMISPDGRVRVVDFGLARPTDPSEGVMDTMAETLRTESGTSQAAVPLPDSIGDPEDSENRVVFGTPAYMAPEQLDGAPVDARCDQFSFCVALYSALYGIRPYPGNNFKEIHQAVKARRLREPKRVQGPKRLRRHVVRGLQLHPNERYPDMPTLLAALAATRRVRRRQIAGGLAGLGALAFGGLGYVGALERKETPCPDASDRLAGIWDQPRRQQLADAFEATGLPYATETWRSAERVLEDYATAWVDARHDACEATHVLGEQSEDLLDLRMQCLDEHLAAFDATTRLFARATGDVVLEAVRAATALPDLSQCGNARLLTARVPPPSDAIMASRVTALRKRLDDTGALVRAAQYADALEALDDIVREAADLGYAPLLAEAKLQEGTVRAFSGEVEPARRTYLEAVWAATSGGDDRSAAAAWIELVYVAGVLARYDEADEHARHAEALLDRLGHDPELEHKLAARSGTIHAARGDYGGALKAYARALEIAEQELGGDKARISAVWNNLGAAHGTMGDHERALADFERSLEISRSIYGDHHPTTATALNNVAISLEHLGRFPEARERYQEALDLRLQSLGARHPDVASSYHNLGSITAQFEQFERALELYERSLSINLAALGPDHPNVALSRNNIGDVLIELGRPREALDHLGRARAIFESKLGPDHPYVAYTLDGLGRAHSALREHDEALRLLESALELRRRRTTDPLEIGVSELHLAIALRAADRDPERAVTLATSARDRFASIGARAQRELQGTREFLDRSR